MLAINYFQAYSTWIYISELSNILNNKLMIKTSSDFRAAARNVLRGRWSEAVLLTFVYDLIVWVFSATVVLALDSIQSGIGSIASLLLLPLSWSYAITFIVIVVEKKIHSSFLTYLLVIRTLVVSSVQFFCSRFILSFGPCC